MAGCAAVAGLAPREAALLTSTLCSRVWLLEGVHVSRELRRETRPPEPNKQGSPHHTFTTTTYGKVRVKNGDSVILVVP